MLKYTIKRVLMLIPTIIGITLFIYLIMSFVPGDPAELLSPPEATAEEVEVLRAELGLDKPVLVQYVNYMWDILHGDFGVSWFTKQPVIATGGRDERICFRSAPCVFAGRSKLVWAQRSNSFLEAWQIFTEHIGPG